MKNTPFVIVLLVLVVVLGTGLEPSVATEPVRTLPEVLSALQQQAARTRSLQGRFVQEKILAMFDQTLRSEGALYYQAPDRLRWELLQPVASGFVVEGDRGVRWNSVSGEKEAFSTPDDPVMSEVAGQLLAWTRMDMDWLEQRYRLELVKGSPVTLYLYPRDTAEADFLAGIKVVFAPQLDYVAEVVMEEQQGDRTRLQFVEIIRNQPLVDGTFRPPVF